MNAATARAHSSDLPINPAQDMATQSKQGLMIARDRGTLIFRGPIDMSDPEQVQIVLDELGDNTVLPEQDLPIEERGTYYFIYITTDDDELLPMLLPEGEARAMVLAFAARRSRAEAEAVLYRHGILPA